MEAAMRVPPPPQAASVDAVPGDRFRLIAIVRAGIGVLFLMLGLFLAILLHSVQHQTQEGRVVQSGIQLLGGLDRFAAATAPGAAAMAGGVPSVAELERAFSALLAQAAEMSPVWHDAAAAERHATARRLIQEAGAAWRALLVRSPGDAPLAAAQRPDAVAQARGTLHQALGLLAEAAVGHSRGLLTLIALCVLLSVLTACCLAWQFRRFHRHAEAVQADLAQLGRGNLAVRLPLKGGGAEFSRMNREVNRMADGLSRQLALHGRSIALIEGCLRNLGSSRQWLQEDAEANRESLHRILGENTRVVESIQGICQAFDASAEQVKAVAREAEQLFNEVSTIAQSTEDASQSVCLITTETELMNMSIDGLHQILGRVDTAVEQVQASVVEMDAAVAEVGGVCQAARGHSREAQRRAAATRESMQRFVDATREIQGFVEVVSGIAEQTNMLALNAAIEAAGAGEAGRGFAVVANEVKALARETATATQKIHDNVTELRLASDQAGDTVAGIVEAIHVIGAAIESIHQASGRQERVHDQVGQAMISVSSAAKEAVGLIGELQGNSGEVFKAANEAAEHTKAVARVTAGVAGAARQLMQHSHNMQAIADGVLDVENNVKAASRSIQGGIGAVYQRVLLSHTSLFHTSYAIDELGGVITGLREAAAALNPSPADAAAPPQDDPVIAHLLWLGRLVEMIRGARPVARREIADGGGCAFGGWLREERRTLPGESAAVRRLEALHGGLHRTGGEICDLLAAGELEGAITALMSLAGIRRELNQAMLAMTEEGGA